MKHLDFAIYMVGMYAAKSYWYVHAPKEDKEMNGGILLYLVLYLGMGAVLFWESK